MFSIWSIAHPDHNSQVVSLYRGIMYIICDTLVYTTLGSNLIFLQLLLGPFGSPEGSQSQSYPVL